MDKQHHRPRTGRLRSSTSNPVLGDNPAPTVARESKSSSITLHRTCSTTNNANQRPSSSNTSLCSSARSLGSNGTEENVRVVVRVRPLSSKEEEKGCKEVVVVDQVENVIEIRNPSLELDREPKSFGFDGVFPGDTPQAELYNQVARPIVENVIEGYNGTIFAYGQTGTGKTFTMEGDNSAPELKGVIPNSFAQIFSHVSKASKDQSFLVRVSYLEIYNEEVRDLLGKDASKKLDVKESFDRGVYVKALSSYVVEAEEGMDRVMRLGNKNRVVGSTNMNLVSSRSHAIFCITVECSTESEDGEKHFRVGKLNLVDLAGSERISKTGATGDRLKEGAKINLSLSCLGNVISALIEGQSHIPYRSSKLTRLLQDSLGGNSRTVMIANIGPADYNYEETVSTLRYANRAKHIRNRARINEDPKDALLRQFENEIEELKRQLMEEDNPRSNLRAPLSSRVEPESDPASSGTNSEEDDDSDGCKAKDDNGEDQWPSHIAPPDSETLSGLKGVIESQEKITSSVQADTEHKKTTLTALKDNVISWKQHQGRKLNLEEKLKAIKKKIMIGGENLLDKSTEQEDFLQRAMKELEVRKEEQQKLNMSLTSIVAEKVCSEERIISLQSLNTALTRRLQRVWKICKRQTYEDSINIEDIEYDRQAVTDDIKKTCQRYGRMQAILNVFIPQSALNLILKCISYNEETASCSLQFIAYSGNNIKQDPESGTSSLMLYGSKTSSRRQKKKPKKIDYGFTSIYDEPDSDDDIGYECVREVENYGDDEDAEEMDIIESDFLEPVDQVYFHDTFDSYYVEGAKVNELVNLMTEEDYSMALEARSIYHPTKPLLVEGYQAPRRYEKRQRYNYRGTPQAQAPSKAPGHYSYGYDPEYGYY